MCRTANTTMIRVTRFIEHGTLYFLTVEDVIIGPVFAYAEALVKTTVFVCLSKQPRRVHKVLA
jgi:hypothetical protein